MGVTNEITKPGDGATYPKSGDKLTMHYTGTLTNGCVRAAILPTLLQLGKFPKIP